MKNTLLIFFILILATACNSGAERVNCPACDLVPESGMCQAAFPRYYYDHEDKECKVFTWGGCNGVVPFETLEACEQCGCE